MNKTHKKILKGGRAINNGLLSIPPLLTQKKYNSKSFLQNIKHKTDAQEFLNKYKKHKEHIKNEGHTEYKDIKVNFISFNMKNPLYNSSNNEEKIKYKINTELIEMSDSDGFKFKLNDTYNKDDIDNYMYLLTDNY